jgi:hypothetical protein
MSEIKLLIILGMMCLGSVGRFIAAIIILILLFKAV